MLVGVAGSPGQRQRATDILVQRWGFKAFSFRDPLDRVAAELEISVESLEEALRWNLEAEIIAQSVMSTVDRLLAVPVHVVISDVATEEQAALVLRRTGIVVHVGGVVEELEPWHASGARLGVPSSKRWVSLRSNASDFEAHLLNKLRTASPHSMRTLDLAGPLVSADALSYAPT